MTTIDNAPTCPGGCNSMDACGCYTEGYVHGKDQAHSEMRAYVEEGHHLLDCGCAPCRTARAVISARWPEIESAITDGVQASVQDALRIALRVRIVQDNQFDHSRPQQWPDHDGR